MLLSLKKYSKIIFYDKLFLKQEYNRVILTTSIFNRKNYFRSLIFYFSLLITNIFTSISHDNFYNWRFIVVYFGHATYSFYTKKTFIK